MKLFMYFIFVALFSVPVVSQDLTREEAAVKKAIEDETENWKQKNYEKWLNCWTPSSFTRYSVGPDGLNFLDDWNEYTDRVARYMKNNPQPGGIIYNKENYSFVISQDLALVTFTENGNFQTRALKKINDDWKLFYYAGIASKRYRTLEHTSALQHFSGHWRLDPASFKVNPPWTFTEMNSYECDFYCDDAGSHMQGEWNFTNQYGSNSTNFNYLLSHDTAKNLSKVMGTHYRSGWTQLLTGEYSSDESIDLTLELYRIDDDQLHSKSDYTFTSEASIHVHEEYYDSEGNVTQTINYDLIKD